MQKSATYFSDLAARLEHGQIGVEDFIDLVTADDRLSVKANFEGQAMKTSGQFFIDLGNQVQSGLLDFDQAIDLICANEPLADAQHSLIDQAIIEAWTTGQPARIVASDGGEAFAYLRHDGTIVWGWNSATHGLCVARGVREAPVFSIARRPR